jgi:hypothetical protein
VEASTRRIPGQDIARTEQVLIGRWRDHEKEAIDKSRNGKMCDFGSGRIADARRQDIGNIPAKHVAKRVLRVSGPPPGYRY